MSKKIDFHAVSETIDQVMAGKVRFSISGSRLLQVRKHHFIEMHNMGMSIKEMHSLFSDQMNGISYQHFANELRQILKEQKQQAHTSKQQSVYQEKESRANGLATLAGSAPAALLVQALPLEVPEPSDRDRDPQAEIQAPAQSPSRSPATPSAQEQKNQEAPPSVKSKRGLTLKEREAQQDSEDDASRSSLYPSVVYRLSSKWDGSWNRSERSALDMNRYGNHHSEYIKHRAVEVYEFLEPEERDAMEADMSDDNFKSSVNKSFLETLQTVTHPEYRVTTVIAYQDGKTLMADAKVVEAVRAGEIRNWYDFDVREREILSKISKGW